MRIVHVIESLDPSRGGPQAVAIRLSAAQAMLGHETHLLAWDIPEKREEIQRSLDGIPGSDLVTTHCPVPSGKLDSILAKPMLQALSKIDKPDVLHLHAVWPPMLIQVAKWARKQGVPYVVMPHGMLHTWSLSQSKWKKKIALALAYRSMLKNASFFHVLNEEEEREVGKLNFGPPLEIIPNGVFLEELEPLPEPGVFRANHPEIGDGPFALFLSRLHYKKGLDYLIDGFAIALKQCPKASLVIVGPDGGELEPSKQRAQSLGISDKVHFTGPVYGNEKIQAYVDAACFCLPSRQEGFSMAILEALATGTPVVISDQCFFDEVQQVDAGKVITLDAQQVGQAMLTYLAGNSVQALTGQAAIELIKSSYTWQKIAEKSIALYER